MTHENVMKNHFGAEPMLQLSSHTLVESVSHRQGWFYELEFMSEPTYVVLNGM